MNLKEKEDKNMKNNRIRRKQKRKKSYEKFRKKAIKKIINNEDLKEYFSNKPKRWIKKIKKEYPEYFI